MQLNLFKGKHSIEPGDTKKCRVCNVVKNINSFSGNPATYVRPECLECLKEVRELRSFLKISNPYPDESYKCPICSKNKKDLEHLLFTAEKVWVLDHCWDSKEFRGYLCQRCNMGLGQLQDSITSLKRAVKYLSTSKEKAE